MNAISKLIRRFTIPPVFAALLLLVVYAAFPQDNGGIGHLLCGIFFLSVLPALAYPLQKHFAHFKDRGREGQRSLAMIFSFVGYLLGTVVSFVLSAPVRLKLLYCEYLLCGVGMLLLNKVFAVKASGHACGVVGPVIMLFYFGLYLPALIGIACILPVYVSSVKTKSHTVRQLVIGSAIPAVVLALLVSVQTLLV
ncbi:MAG: hypothetical protein E7655_05040 [Ruminococcaceae bacterium]|nr:hypothetical protein [Oscillospiraceae bacterium]